MAHTTQMMVNGVMTNVTVFDNSAQDIDDSVTRAKEGGAIDIALSNKLNKAGDTIGGAVAFSPLKLQGAASNTFLTFLNAAGAIQGYLGFAGTNPTYQGTDNVAKTLLHTGNKPTGSYTGNGDATARTITTGGIGRAVLVWRQNYSVLVLPQGAICANGATLTSVSASVAYTTEGAFVIADNNDRLNANGVTYYYQVL